MTTTAEKIEYIETRLALTEGDLKQAIGVINALQKELVDVKQSTKPADPESLECWVNIYNAGIPIHAFETEAEALRSADDANSAYLERIAVRMLEVTPQDEQDRKDAARYRKVKNNRKLQHRLYDYRSRGKWDEMIDKAIEDQ